MWGARSLAPLVALLALGATRAAADEVDERLRALARSAGQEVPLVRIGLEDRHRLVLASRGGLRIVDPRTGEPIWKPRFDEEVGVLAEGGPAEGGGPAVFRVQVGAFGDRAAAEQERERLERLAGTSGVVHHDPDRGNWRVRLGSATDRLALAPLVERLRQAGMRELWIAEEAGEPVAGVRLRLADEQFSSVLVSSERIAVVPAGKQPLAVDGTAYRGVIELRLGRRGTIQPVDWVGLEPYLLGVVPAELGPEQWPQLAALRAQAVAARTYVWRNLGQFAEDGFDVCATARCQVYGGIASEHPLSDRAVWSTRGEILTWQGAPIVALYTATCGGHTEDGGAVFAEHDEPYLKGVPCRAEGEALASQRAQLAGRSVEPLVDETGTDVTRSWALLAVAGVLERAPDASRTREPLTAEELRRATRALARLAGRPPPEGPARGVATLGQAAAALAADLGWAERAGVLVDAEDWPALLRDAETAGLSREEQSALAYLAAVEAVRPFPDGRMHADLAPTLARIAPALVRIGESYEAFGLRSGTVAGAAAHGIRVVQDQGTLGLPVAGDAFLFGRVGGRPVAGSRLELWPGDRVRFRSSSAGAIDFLELEPPVKGVADDRAARLFSWEVRRSRRELEAAINRRVSIGRLEDLVVRRRGVSGRVIELGIVGSEGTTVVRGFDVRRLLDLRESLLVMEIQRDAQGRIDAVVFAGKGWGHGVGLCQVGAYGMALRGATYPEILTHYYPGTKLEPLGSPAR